MGNPRVLSHAGWGQKSKAFIPFVPRQVLGPRACTGHRMTHGLYSLDCSWIFSPFPLPRPKSHSSPLASLPPLLCPSPVTLPKPKSDHVTPLNKTQQWFPHSQVRPSVPGPACLSTPSASLHLITVSVTQHAVPCNALPASHRRSSWILQH